MALTAACSTNARTPTVIGAARNFARLGRAFSRRSWTSIAANRCVVALSAAAATMAGSFASGLTLSTYRLVLSTWVRTPIAVMVSGARRELTAIRTAARVRRQRGWWYVGAAGTVSAAAAPVNASSRL